MPTVVSTPVKAWLATLNAGGFISHGQALTVTVNITGAWEIQIPIGVRYGANVSLAALIGIYPSSDGGANFDSVALQSFAIPTLASGRQVLSVRLTTGQYVVTVTMSSPSGTVFVLTQEAITGVINV